MWRDIAAGIIAVLILTGVGCAAWLLPVVLGRGEDHEPDFAEHADQAMAVLAGSDLDYALREADRDRLACDSMEYQFPTSRFRRIR